MPFALDIDVIEVTNYELSSVACVPAWSITVSTTHCQPSLCSGHFQAGCGMEYSSTEYKMKENVE